MHDFFIKCTYPNKKVSDIINSVKCKGGDDVPKTKVRRYCFDNDCVEVIFRLDESGRCWGDYPDFEETPCYTKSGYPWVNAMQDACRYGVNQYNAAQSCLDCGSCCYYRTERHADLIGICQNENKREKDSYAKLEL